MGVGRLPAVRRAIIGFLMAVAAGLGDGGSAVVGVDVRPCAAVPEAMDRAGWAGDVASGCALVNLALRQFVADPRSDSAATLLVDAAHGSVDERLFPVLDALWRRVPSPAVARVRAEVLMGFGADAAAAAAVEAAGRAADADPRMLLVAVRLRLRHMNPAQPPWRVIAMLGDMLRGEAVIAPDSRSGQRAAEVIGLVSPAEGLRRLVRARRRLGGTADDRAHFLIALGALTGDDDDPVVAESLLTRALFWGRRASVPETAYAALARRSGVAAGGSSARICGLVGRRKTMLRLDCEMTVLRSAWSRGDLGPALQAERRLHRRVLQNGHVSQLVQLAKIGVPLLRLVGGYDEADELGRAAIDRAGPLVSAQTMATLRMQRSAVLRETGRLTEARRQLQLAFVAAGPEGTPELYLERAQLARAAGDPAAARGALATARRLARTAGARERMAVELGNVSGGGSSPEASRWLMRSLGDLVGEAMGGVAENVLGGRLAELSGDLDEADSRYALASARLDEGLTSVHDDLARAAIRSAWRDLSARRASVALRRQDVEGAFDALQRGRGGGDSAAAWSHVRGHLDPGEMVLLIANVDGSVWAFAATPEHVRAVRLPAEASALASLAAMWRKTVNSVNPNLTEQIGARIATATIGTIEDTGLLRGVDTVVVIAEGELQNVAFGALDARGGGVMGDSVSFTRSGSLAALERAWHQPSSTGAAVVFVPGRSPTARAEIRSVLRLQPGRSYLGASATETAFLHGATAAGLVHFGGHSFAPVGPGQEGGLLLKGDSGHDGLVTYQQIAALDLSGATVVLLGCDTARRASWPQRAVGGLPSSLADAFFAAGSRTVIGSLWEIDDRTAFEFAAAFYGAGGPAAGPVSLRRARRQMRARYPLQPRRWAGVVWEGVPRPIQNAAVDTVQ